MNICGAWVEKGSFYENMCVYKEICDCDILFFHSSEGCRSL